MSRIYYIMKYKNIYVFFTSYSHNYISNNYLILKRISIFISNINRYINIISIIYMEVKKIMRLLLFYILNIIDNYFIQINVVLKQDRLILRIMIYFF